MEHLNFQPFFNGLFSEKPLVLNLLEKYLEKIKNYHRNKIHTSYDSPLIDNHDDEIFQKQVPQEKAADFQRESDFDPYRETDSTKKKIDRI